MRHDWTLLCTDVRFQPLGPIDLVNVISILKLADPSLTASPMEKVSIEAPIILVSQWSAEFETDKIVHSAILQFLAPGGDDVLREYNLTLDLRETTVIRVIHHIPDFDFVGTGTYEFHIVLDTLAAVGEWGRDCLTIN